MVLTRLADKDWVWLPHGTASARLDTFSVTLTYLTRPRCAGTPDEPTGVLGISDTTEGTSLTIAFDRPESDTAEVC